MMLSPLVPLVVAIILIAYSIVSYLIWVRTSTYARFMVNVIFMVLIPLAILTLDLQQDTALLLIGIAELVMVANLGYRYNQAIASPYREMLADMTRVVDDQDLNINSLNTTDDSTEMKKLQTKQTIFVENIRSSLSGIELSYSDLDGHVHFIEDKIQSMGSEVNALTSDVDEILQTSAILAETIFTIKNATLEFIDKLNSDFDILEEVSRTNDRTTDQTNIIAVNAAIEAAQSESTHNFSEVADSIQHLARRSRDTTDRLYGSIAKMRKLSEKEVKAINSNLTKVEEIIDSLGELANKSSNLAHSQQIISGDILAQTKQAKEANTKIRGNFDQYKL